MKILNHVIELSFRGRNKFTHMKLHRNYEDRSRYRSILAKPLWYHFVWWKISLIFGQPHLELVTVCGECWSGEIGEVSAGDEGWTVCRNCQTIEGPTEEITMEEYEAL
jgi:hypothetical protein